MSKQARIFLSRDITVVRAGKDSLKLKAGANMVDADVAENDFVRAHCVDAPTVADNKADARVAELAKENKDLDRELHEVREQLAAATTELAAVKEQLATKTAELDAMVAAAAPKPRKS